MSEALYEEFSNYYYEEDGKYKIQWEDTILESNTLDGLWNKYQNAVKSTPKGGKKMAETKKVHELLKEIEDDLVQLCEDNDIMKETIRNYFTDMKINPVTIGKSVSKSVGAGLNTFVMNEIEPGLSDIDIVGYKKENPNERFFLLTVAQLFKLCINQGLLTVKDDETYVYKSPDGDMTINKLNTHKQIVSVFKKRGYKQNIGRRGVWGIPLPGTPVEEEVVEGEEIE